MGAWRAIFGFSTRSMCWGRARIISRPFLAAPARRCRLYDALSNGEDAAALAPPVAAFRQAVQAAGLIGAMKAALAIRRGEPRWLTLRPPMLNATPAEGEALLAALGPLADGI